MTKLTQFLCALALCASFPAAIATAEKATELLDSEGMVIAEQTADGDIHYLKSPRIPTNYPPLFKAPRLPKEADPEAYTYRYFNDPENNRRVQPDGTVVPIDRSRPVTPTKAQSTRASSTTVDSMTLTTYEGQYAPYLPLFLQGQPSRYTLSDGTNFFSGSLSLFRGKVQLTSISEQNGTITYTFERFGEQLFLDVNENAQFENATAFELTLEGEFTLEATVGSDTAVLTGDLLVTNTDPVSTSDERFSPLSAVVGSTIPYTMTMINTTSVWTADSFDSGFSYSVVDGEMDFANPTTSPSIVDLRLSGPQQLPPDISTQLQAIAVYENGEELQVNSSAIWSTPNGDLFDLTPGGLLTTSSPPAQDTPVVVFAQFQSFQGQLDITLIGEGTLAQTIDGWSTFQRGPSRAGWADLATEQNLFNVLWTVPIPLNSFYSQPVADDSVVIVSSANSFFSNDGLDRMFAFDPLTGSLLWSKGFPGVRQINGPALAYGNVIVVGESNNVQEDILQSLNALTGDQIYSRSFPSNQVEGETPAPAVYEGDIYVRGSFSSIYRINLFTGDPLWSNTDTNNDRNWSPSVDEQYVYQYNNEILSVIERATGELAFQLEQPIDQFSSSRFAVVLNEDSSAAFVLFAGDVSKFNLIDKRHEWTIDANYSRQPTYHDGRLYTYTSNEFVALDASDGSVLWTYDPAIGGSFSEDIVMTTNHAFVGHGSRTIAIDLNSEQEVWEFNARGRLSISGENLYIATGNQLTAVQIPGLLNVAPASIDIVGPTTVEEDSTTQYRATVTYEDGRIRDRTLQVQWTMKPSQVATLGQSGRLSVGELLVPQDSVTLSAAFTEAGVKVETTVDVQLATLLSNEDFALRNLEIALAIKEGLLEQLADATQREQSARAALESLTDPDAQQAFQEVVNALDQGATASGAIDSGVMSLTEAIAILRGDTRPWDRRSR